MELESSMELDWEIKVRLESDTPVMGVELNPWIHINVRSSYHSPPNYSVRCTWYREEDRYHASEEESESKKYWLEVGSTRTYTPSEDDVGSKLLLLSFATDDEGKPKSLTNMLLTNPVIQLPRHQSRPMLVFTSLKRLLRTPNEFTAKPFKDGSFRVLSYNILADLYAKSRRDVYTCRCPDWALTWEYRRQNLLGEMMSYDADIICLQEVQSDHFKYFFQPEFAKFGYSAVYKKKTKEVYNGEQYVIDGCATFFKHDRFKMVVKYEVEYDKLALPVIKKLEPGRRDEGAFRLMKDNVALVVILEVKEDCHSWPSDAVGSRLCVANTHIHRGGSDASDVRMFQVVNLIRGLEKIDAVGFPVLLCGDMNSVPGSDPHRFLVNGKVGCFGQKLSRGPLGVYKNLQLSHSMCLASAYSSWLLDSNEVEQQHKWQKVDYQTMKPKPSSSGTLDYILYSENRLKVDGLLKLLDCNDSRGKRSLPSPQWSSDHVALMANFRIKKAFRGRQYLSPPPDPWGQKLTQCQIPYVEKNMKTKNSGLLLASAY